MTIKTEIPSNLTTLRIADESSFKTLTGTDVWRQREPNEYGDFGGNTVNTPRRPISVDRSLRKGVITDLSAVAEWTEDLTQNSLQRLIEGFMFADFREKALFGADSLTGIAISGIVAATDTFTVASGGASCDADDLVFGAGFTNAANNGLHVVASSTATTVVVGDGTVNETPPSTATLTRVGHEFAAGDLSVTNTGTAFPTITSAGGKDLTELDIVPGEWVYIGGDATLNKWATADNNGYARVRSVTATVMTFDKTQNTMVTEAGGALEIRIFTGRVVKNEPTADLIVQKFYQLERTLGAPDTAALADEQAEYVIGAAPDELVINWPTSEIITTEFKMMGADHETKAATTPGLKAGTRPALSADDAYNSANHARRLSMSTVSSTVADGSPLFTYLKEMTISIKNNLSLNKAIGTLGGVASNYGYLEISVEATAYFATVAGLAAKRNNDDITIDAHLADQNRGISFDVPLLAIGEGLPEIEGNEAIMLPLTNAAAKGIDVDSTYTHTALMQFFDYLPSAAEA